MSKIRTYSELRQIETFIDRYRYLQLRGVVGDTTFGFDRWINQAFYHSHEWKTVRDRVIVRDQGCDLGIPGYEIHSGLIVHHMNPITFDDLDHGGDFMIDPEFLITTSLPTHNAIHYGDENLLPRGPVTRSQDDTKLW